jgi:WD40 repeat protein
MPNNVNTIAIGRDDSSISLIDLRCLGKIARYREKSNINAITSLQFSNSGRLLFSCAAAANRIVCWDVLSEEKSGECGPEVL